MENETYKLNAMCQNCDFEGEVEIKKGVALDESVCPQCGCVELIKSPEVTRLKPHTENYN